MKAIQMLAIAVGLVATSVVFLSTRSWPAFGLLPMLYSVGLFTRTRCPLSWAWPSPIWQGV